MNLRLVQAGPATLAAVVVLLATRVPLHALSLLVAAGLSLGLGPMFRVGVNAQRLTMLISAAFGAAVGLLLVPASPQSPTLAGLWCAVATALAFASLVRATFQRPEGGTRAGFAFVIGTLLVAGQVHTRGVYLPASGVTLVAALLAMRASDPGRPPLRVLGARNRWMAAGVVAGATVFTVAMGWVLPRLHARIMVRFLESYRESAESGLDGSLELGALASLTQSDELVLRVHGRGVDRLRGAVYDSYTSHAWRSSRGPAHRIVRVGPGPVNKPDAVMVERVGGIRGWVMVPLPVASIATEAGSVRVDPMGVVRSIPGDPALRVWFTPGARTSLAPSPPTPADLALPGALREPLTRIADRFGAGGATPFERIDRIADALRTRYHYALTFQRTDNRDPVLDFLDTHPRGHCEYFASALALLGRAAGVPTRVVGGYRVAERNPLGDYYVVREKNAHAWVEAWDPARGWVTLDATPASEIPQNLAHETRWTAALGDGAAVAAGRVRAWFGARTSEQLLGVALALLVAWLAWRTWRSRAEAVELRTGGSSDKPLPCWDALASALSSRGIVRSPHETLEAYAARVSSTDLLAPALRDDAAAAIREYAALRYGAPADEAAMVRRANDVARALHQ